MVPRNSSRRRRLGGYVALRASLVGAGISKTPRAGQRRRCSHRSLERILSFLGRSLGPRAVWRIELVEKLGKTAMIVPDASPPGCAVLCI